MATVIPTCMSPAIRLRAFCIATGGMERLKRYGIASGAALNEDGQEQAGMGVAIADYDNDGDLDIAKTNFSDDAP